MAKLHFIRVDIPLSTSELVEFCDEIEAGFIAKGRPNDKAILLSMSSWLGSVEIDNED